MNADNLPSPGDINGTGRLRAICAKAISYAEIRADLEDNITPTGTDLSNFFAACLTKSNAVALQPQWVSPPGGGGGGAVIAVEGMQFIENASPSAPPNITWRSVLTAIGTGNPGSPLPEGVDIEPYSESAVIVSPTQVSITPNSPYAIFEIVHNGNHFGFLTIEVTWE